MWIYTFERQHPTYARYPMLDVWSSGYSRYALLFRNEGTFPPRARRSPPRASVTWPLRNSDSIIAMGLSARRSISPADNAEGRVIRSFSGVNHSSG